MTFVANEEACDSVVAVVLNVIRQQGVGEKYWRIPEDMIKRVQRSLNLPKTPKNFQYESESDSGVTSQTVYCVFIKRFQKIYLE